jgi:hypothetical protein
MGERSPGLIEDQGHPTDDQLRIDRAKLPGIGTHRVVVAEQADRTVHLATGEPLDDGDARVARMPGHHYITGSPRARRINQDEPAGLERRDHRGTGHDDPTPTP